MNHFNEIKVSLWARWLAWLYLLILVLGGLFAFKKFLIQGYPLSLLPFDFSVMGLISWYITVLFGYVAITGKSPSKWFPIANLRFVRIKP